MLLTIDTRSRQYGEKAREVIQTEHIEFDLGLHSYEPRRVLPQRPLRTSRQVFSCCSMINRSPRCALRYVQIHWKKTLNRKLFSARNCMWIKAHTSHAKKPLILTRPLCSTAKFLPTTAR